MTRPNAETVLDEAADALEGEYWAENVENAIAGAGVLALIGIGKALLQLSEQFESLLVNLDHSGQRTYDGMPF